MSNACTIFSPKIDFAAAAKSVNNSFTNQKVSIVGEPDYWSQIFIQGNESNLAMGAMTINNSGEEFTNMVLDLHSLFSKVQTDATDIQQKLLTLIQAFQMAIAVVAKPEFNDNDNHTQGLFNVAKSVNGLVFVGGGALVDYNGKIILDIKGKSDAYNSN